MDGPAFLGSLATSQDKTIESVTFRYDLAILRKAGLASRTPRFSLIMPTENRPQYIQEAVKSVMEQDFSDWELLIKDAGQSIKHLLPDDPRIKHKCVWGSNFERFNRRSKEAAGGILNFCADDDVMLPGALRHVHESIGDWQWFYGRIRRTDSGNIQGEAWDRARFNAVNIVPTPATFWTRKARGTVGEWKTDIACPDYDYWHRLVEHWKPGCTDRVLVDYRVHPAQDTWKRDEQMKRDVAAVVAAYAGDRKLYIAPHCSTGGMPQYLLGRVKEDLAAGLAVRVLEWENVSGEYTVQRKQIAALCELTTLNGNRPEELRRIIESWKPTAVHLQEFPEMFMDTQSAELVYRRDRPYKLIETGHSTRLKASEKRLKPDEFAFVGDWHANEFKDFGVPFVMAPHKLERRTRPDRATALRALNLDPDKRHVLSVGLFAPWKAQDYAFQIARQMPDLEFHFVGNQAGNFRSFWEPLMANKPPNCNVWGERSDVDSFYSAMDLLFFPSTEECSPIVVKEALAWKMPVLMRRLDSCAKEFGGRVTFMEGDDSAVIQQIRALM